MTISQRALVDGVSGGRGLHRPLLRFLRKARMGEWGLRRQPIYEKDRIDPVDPAAVLQFRPGLARAFP